MQLIRKAALAAALVTALVAVFAVVLDTLQARDARSHLAQARDYEAIAQKVRLQQRLMTAGARRSAMVAPIVESVTEDVDRLFVDLRRRSKGKEREQAAALARAYRAASYSAFSSLNGALGNRGAAESERASRALGKVRTSAAKLRRRRRDALAARLASSTTTAERTAVVLCGGAALVATACLFVLAPGRRRRRRQRDDEIAVLKAAARTDSLTGLGNHRSFHHDLSLAMQFRTARGSTFALMAVDLDGLKQINDTQGHQAGDAYIRKASECLRQAVGDHGTVYRTGGDEFMVLLPNRRSYHALATARVVDQLTRAALGRRAVSIGITESTSTEARHVLIHQADMALYDAKRADTAAVVFYPAHNRRADDGQYAPSHQETLAAALARAVDAKDTGTRSHSETVAELAVAIGEQLGIRGERLQRLRRAGLLHDVGKIGVPDTILKKATSLDSVEQAEMKAHVGIGHAILNAAEMPVEAEWVLHHHERCDGDGYPSGLGVGDIPIESRILAVADAFEAMTGERPYSAFLTTAEALVELDRHAGSQFDPRCVEALREVLERTEEAKTPHPLPPADNFPRLLPVATARLEAG